MTTEERLEKIEQELAAAKQINRWRLTAVVLAASLLCMVAKEGFFVTLANAGDVDSISYDVEKIKSTVGSIESTVANIKSGIGGFNSRNTLYDAVGSIKSAVTGVPHLL